MSIQSFNVTSPEFWVYGDSMYYSGGWKTDFWFFMGSWLSPNLGTQDEYASDPYAYVGGHPFWTEHANDVLLKITAYGQDSSDGSHGPPGDSDLHFSVNASEAGVATITNTSMVEIDYSNLPVLVTPKDVYHLDLSGNSGTDYASGNGIFGIFFTLDVLDAGVELVWKYPMSVREKY